MREEDLLKSLLGVMTGGDGCLCGKCNKEPEALVVRELTSDEKAVANELEAMAGEISSLLAKASKLDDLLSAKKKIFWYGVESSLPETEKKQKLRVDSRFLYEVKQED